MPAPAVRVTVARRVLCARCTVADTPGRRLRGLMGRHLAPDAGLLLRRTASVHTCFMRGAIDVVFVGRDGRVLRIVPALAPWRLVWCRGARAVLELPPGRCAASGLRRGDALGVAAGGGPP